MYMVVEELGTGTTYLLSIEEQEARQEILLMIHTGQVQAQTRKYPCDILVLATSILFLSVRVEFRVASVFALSSSASKLQLENEGRQPDSRSQ
ncbi:hypothetical protein B296_00001555 [Ensete ventricosum]|uniref:Uncharacterized protein n=1 Tax=Ensete ventricosum TaxID=4639 RepID=A0A426YJG4_ENSVE|nr:hypothetical protein B296_00001555 [Ensete ventricosum]